MPSECRGRGLEGFPIDLGFRFRLKLPAQRSAAPRLQLELSESFGLESTGSRTPRGRGERLKTSSNHRYLFDADMTQRDRNETAHIPRKERKELLRGVKQKN